MSGTEHVHEWDVAEPVQVLQAKQFINKELQSVTPQLWYGDWTIPVECYTHIWASS